MGTGERVWLGGRVCDLRDAHVSVRERSFRYGEGVFATLRIERSRILELDAALERLHLGCDAIGLKVPPEVASAATLLRVLAALGADRRRHDRVVRIQVSGGAAGRGYAPPEKASSWALVELFPLPARRRLVLSVAEDGELLRPPAASAIKSCSALAHVLLARAAAARGAHEAVRLVDGVVTEASAANVFWLRGGSLWTPGDGLPLYAGLTRAAVLEAAAELGMEVRSGAFPARELRDAEAAFLTNAVRGVERVWRLDGRMLAWPDELNALRRAMRRRRRARSIPLRSLDGRRAS